MLRNCLPYSKFLFYLQRSVGVKLLFLPNYQLTDAFSVLCIDFLSTSIFRPCHSCFKMLSTYHLYGNFRQMALVFFFFGTKKRNRIELCHLQNTGKSFAFSWHQAWHGRFGKNGKTVIPQKVLQENFHRDEPFNLNSPRNFRVFHTNGKRSLFKMNHVFTVKWTVIGSFQSFFFASRRENFSMRWLCKRCNYGNEDKLSESNSDSRSSIFRKMVHLHR